MNKFKLALEIKQRLEDLESLVDMFTDDDMIGKPYEPALEDIEWSEDLSRKTYLELAKQDLRCAKLDKNNLKSAAHTVTVLIAQCFEKCLCHLLMLKGEKFTPTHSHSKLLRLVQVAYPKFPKYFTEVDASLCELWYQTNRYPQRSQRGYESYYLILNMLKVCENLVHYCDEEDRKCKGIEFNFKEYEASRLLSQEEIGDLITRDTLNQLKKNRRKN